MFLHVHVFDKLVSTIACNKPLNRACIMSVKNEGVRGHREWSQEFYHVGGGNSCLMKLKVGNSWFADP